MQLKQQKSLKTLLTAATCSLLGTTSQAESIDSWEFDTAIMHYMEADRVSATEAIIGAKKTFANDEILNIKLTFDSLTGASPNGAIAQPRAQTFTRPSGSGQYQIKSGDTPLDDTFKDTRIQFTGQWSQPLNNDYTLSVGGNFSNEYDYMSASLNANLAKDFNNKNTTASFGFSYAYDIIKPEGGIRQPFSAMVIGEPRVDDDDDDEDNDNEKNCLDTCLADDDSKSTVDLLFGITQVINRRMIMQLNYSFSSTNGYLTDPFKVLSVIDSNGDSQSYLYESRPEKRNKHAFYAQTKYHLSNAIIDASYRYMTDDWDIDSHTIDFRYRLLLENGHFIEPHIRWYSQSAADFYQPYLIQGNVIEEFASADYRIGELDTYTVGLKYGLPMANGSALSFRLEYYHQTPKNTVKGNFSSLKNMELNEEVDAIIAQVSYSF